MSVVKCTYKHAESRKILNIPILREIIELCIDFNVAPLLSWISVTHFTFSIQKHSKQWIFNSFFSTHFSFCSWKNSWQTLEFFFCLMIVLSLRSPLICEVADRPRPRAILLCRRNNLFTHYGMERKIVEWDKKKVFSCLFWIGKKRVIFDSMAMTVTNTSPDRHLIKSTFQTPAHNCLANDIHFTRFTK